MSRTLTLELDDQTYRFLREAAQAENRSLASFIETGVLAWIREHRVIDPTKSEESPLQQAVNEAERGLELGQWVDHEEVAAKLKRWAVGDT